MPYVQFKGLLKKINLKPKGVQEIVLEVKGDSLDGKLDEVSNMIDHNVEIQFDSLTVNYKVLVDAATNEPVHDYKFDNNGAYEQIELFDPLDSIEEEETISREIIDQFILDGLGPDYENYPKHFSMYIRRKLEGESYHKLASELGISSPALVELMDKYRVQVAALAKSYDTWKKKRNG